MPLIPNNQLLNPIARPVLNVPELAKTSLISLPDLPDIGGVYLALDNASRVWYVGIADSLRQRLCAHDRLPDFKRKGVTSVAWQPESNPAKRALIEQELIQTLHPPLNNIHNLHALPLANLGLGPNEEIDRYFRLKIQLKLIEQELEILKPNIVSRCEEAPDGKLRHRLGLLYVLSYKSWQYSPEVCKLQEELKIRKQTERENGTATVKSVSTSPIARIKPEAVLEDSRILVSRIDAEPQEFAEAC